MKNQTLVAIIAVLVIVLGLQTYGMFRINDRLNQLVDRDQIKIPNLSQPGSPGQNFDDDFFNGRSWSPYEEMQHIQDEMVQLFDI